MSTIKKPTVELHTKLENAKAIKRYVNKVLEYLEDEVREIEQKDLELKNGAIIRDFNKNLLAEKDQQLLDKESIIAEKSERISQLEEELADAEIKVNRSVFLITQHKQEMKKREFQVQQLESMIEQSAELHVKRKLDEETQFEELKSVMSAKTLSTNAKSDQKEYVGASAETSDNYQHELLLKRDEEINKLHTLVDEKEQFILQLQKQMELVENKLKMTVKETQKLNFELQITKKELLTSKQLANETTIREMKQYDMSEELKSILSVLTKDTAKIAEELRKKQYSTTHSYSKDDTAADTKEMEEVAKESNVSCSDDHLRRLRTIYPQLIERFDAKKLVGWMFAQHAIRLSELQSILSCRTACEAAEGLLKIILNEQSERIFECFLNALNKTSQQHISAWISYSDYDIDSEHVQLIQRHHVYLVDNIDSLHSGLLDQLYAKEVIDLRDMEQLKAEQTQTSCNEKLVSMLGCKSAQQFEEFLSSLRATGQDFIAKKLMGENHVSIIHRKNNADSSDHGYQILDLIAAYEQVAHEQDLPGRVSLSDSDQEQTPKLEAKTASTTFTKKLKAALGLQVLHRDNPRLLFTLEKPPTDSDTGPYRVRGLTILNNCLYVAYENNEKVAVFDCEDHCVKVKDIAVEGLKKPCDMVGSSVTSQLFISQWGDDVILRVDSKTDARELFIETGCKDTRLSLVQNRLLVTSRDSVLMFDIFSGERMKKIPFTENSKGHGVWHAIESNRDSFFVCHGQSSGISTVSEIDSDGRKIRVFDNKQQLHCYHLALDSIGRLLVTDLNNRRVVLLNEHLDFERTLIDDKQLDNAWPFRLCYSLNNNKLTVGLNNGLVKIFKYHVID